MLFGYKKFYRQKQSAKKTRKKKKGSSSVKTESVDGNQSNKSKGGANCETDCHDEMDHEKYEKYFEENVCANVPHISTLIIDDASYHSKYTENYLKSTWRKQQYVDWLKENKIAFLKDALRLSLRQLVKEKRTDSPYYH